MQKIVPALNAHLPPDIRAVDIRSVPDGFHARYAAHAKTYRYYILNARVDDPFTYDTCHRVGAALQFGRHAGRCGASIGTTIFPPSARPGPAPPPTGIPCGRLRIVLLYKAAICLQFP